jgi:hydroxyacylglutathione hydrolase
MSIFPNARINGEGVPEVTPEEALAQARNPEVSLIDVRRPDEYTGELGHAAGAKLVTLETDFLKWVETADPSKTYVFLCRSGARSSRAAGIALSKGVKAAYNMEGGMMLWNAAGLPVER